MKIRVINETGLAKDTRVVDKFGRSVGGLISDVNVHMDLDDGVVTAEIKFVQALVKSKDVEWRVDIDVVRQLAEDHGYVLVKKGDAHAPT